MWWLITCLWLVGAGDTSRVDVTLGRLLFDAGVENRSISLLQVRK